MKNMIELHDAEDYYLRISLIPRFMEDDQQLNHFEASLLDKKLVAIGQAIGTNYIYTTLKGAKLIGIESAEYKKHRQASLDLWRKLENRYSQIALREPNQSKNST